MGVIEHHIADPVKYCLQYDFQLVLFDFFGSFSNEDIEKRYQENRSVPCSIEHWQLDESKYKVLTKAVNPDRSKRFQTISQFWTAWKNE